MIKFHKILGLISVIGAIGLTITAITLSFIDDMPTHIFWKLIVWMPFILIYGLRELRKAQIMQYEESIKKN